MPEVRNNKDSRAKTPEKIGVKTSAELSPAVLHGVAKVGVVIAVPRLSSRLRELHVAVTDLRPSCYGRGSQREGVRRDCSERKIINRRAVPGRLCKRQVICWGIYYPGGAKVITVVLGKPPLHELCQLRERRLGIGAPG